MKNFIGLILGFIILTSAIFSSVCPFPFTKGNLTISQIEKINDYFEVETQALSSNTTQSTISLDWFDVVNIMFENFVDTQLFDIKTKTTFLVQRTGGIGHADIEPSDEENTQKLLSIIENSQINRRPMLAYIHNTWIACSLWTNIHGYGLITTNNLDGHLCLHFLNSKTDSTNKVDYSHQKTISQAIKLSKKFYPTN